jgi:hypothetical protein
MPFIYCTGLCLYIHTCRKLSQFCLLSRYIVTRLIVEVPILKLLRARRRAKDATFNGLLLGEHGGMLDSR